jgi:hypothetical protein
VTLQVWWRTKPSIRYPNDRARGAPSIAWPPSIEIVGNRRVAADVSATDDAGGELRAQDPVGSHDRYVLGPSGRSSVRDLLFHRGKNGRPSAKLGRDIELGVPAGGSEARRFGNERPCVHRGHHGAGHRGRGDHTRRPFGLRGSRRRGDESEQSWSHPMRFRDSAPKA